MDHITQLVADSERYSECKIDDMPPNYAAMAAVVVTSTSAADLQEKLPQTMKNADNDPNIIDITLCHAVDSGLITGKDLEIPQVTLVVTPNGSNNTDTK